MSEKRAFDSGKLFSGHCDNPVALTHGGAGRLGLLAVQLEACLAQPPEKGLGSEGGIFLLNTLCPCQEHLRGGTHGDGNWTVILLFFHLPPHFLGQKFFRKSMKNVTETYWNRINWRVSRSQKLQSKGSFPLSHLTLVGLLETIASVELSFILVLFIRELFLFHTRFNLWFCVAWFNCASDSQCSTSHRTTLSTGSCLAFGDTF